MAEVFRSSPCPSCAKRLPSEAKACPYCGWTSVGTKVATANPGPGAYAPVAELPALQDVRTEQVSYLLPDACPLCSSQDIRSVASVVSQGTWASKSTGSTASVGYVVGAGPIVTGGSIGASKFGMNDLAKLLSPPVIVPQLEPDKSGMASFNAGCSFFVILIVIGGVGSSIFPAKHDGDGHSVADPMAVMITIIGVMLGLLAGWAIYESTNKSASEALQKREQILRDAQSRNARFKAIWERLYYCQKCHTVHDPATGRHARAENADSLY